MKLALLGVDPESLALAQAARDAGHDIVWGGDLAETPLVVAADRGDAWEELLDDQSCDAVLIGRGRAPADLRMRQTQDLAKQGRPLLTTFPLADSVLGFFEVDMARSEGKGLVDHFNPCLGDRPTDELQRSIRDGHPELGRIEQVQCVRRLADRSPASVVRQFARDVDRIEAFAGTINRIGAHGAAGAEAAYATLSVQLLGPSGLPIRWGVEPPEAQENLVVTLIGSQGRTSITVGEQLHESAAESLQRFVAKWDGVRAGRLEAPSASSWPQALHAMEIADSIEISLRKGRMIEIHAQQLSEQLAFKGTMAAAGCGVLVVVVPLMLALGWGAGLLGVPLARYWPHALLLLLGAFLALQLLSKLVYAANRDEPERKR